MLNDEQMTQDMVMVISCFGVVVFAVLAAAMKKQSKKTEFVEFAVDAENCPAPKESKKEIKKTLKNIMAKNSAKTSLIA